MGSSGQLASAPERCSCFGVERPTWPFSAATCRRASAPQRLEPTDELGAIDQRRAGRPLQRAGGPFHPDFDRYQGLLDSYESAAGTVGGRLHSVRSRWLASAFWDAATCPRAPKHARVLPCSCVACRAHLARASLDSGSCRFSMRLGMRSTPNVVATFATPDLKTPTSRAIRSPVTVE
jgi:hypothetical protein